MIQPKLAVYDYVTTKTITMPSTKIYKMMKCFCISCRGIKCHVCLRIFKASNIKLQPVLKFIPWERLSRSLNFNPTELSPCTDLVPQVSVLVSHQVEQVEGDRQEGGAQKVPDGGQVGDGNIVRVIPEPPYEVYHPVADIQKDDDLQND